MIEPHIPHYNMRFKHHSTHKSCTGISTHAVTYHGKHCTHGRFSTLEGSTTSFLTVFLVATGAFFFPSLSESSSAAKKFDCGGINRTDVSYGT
jgi:hypothetical protein